MHQSIDLSNARTDSYELSTLAKPISSDFQITEADKHAGAGLKLGLQNKQGGPDREVQAVETANLRRGPQQLCLAKSCQETRRYAQPEHEQRIIAAAFNTIN